MASPVTSTDNLAHVYPNVGAELCNRHVKQLSKLKCLFADIYDGTSNLTKKCNRKHSSS